MNVDLQLPEEVVDAIARRAAELVLERLPASSSTSDWLTVDEAAAFLRCAPQRIYDLRVDGRLGRYTEGRRALIKRDELVRLVVDEDARPGVRRAA